MPAFYRQGGGRHHLGRAVHGQTELVYGRVLYQPRSCGPTSSPASWCPTTLARASRQGAGLVTGIAKSGLWLEGGMDHHEEGGGGGGDRTTTEPAPPASCSASPRPRHLRQLRLASSSTSRGWRSASAFSRNPRLLGVRGHPLLGEHHRPAPIPGRGSDESPAQKPSCCPRPSPSASSSVGTSPSAGQEATSGPGARPASSSSPASAPQIHRGLAVPGERRLHAGGRRRHPRPAC